MFLNTKNFFFKDAEKVVKIIKSEERKVKLSVEIKCINSSFGYERKHIVNNLI